MKLLIITQKVDKNDPILGFFHRWIEEFAKYFNTVYVLCLEKGKYDLPKNVVVYSLGKEKRISKITYLIKFYYYIFKLRKNYNTVFIHMNPIYIILGGVFWRFWHKKISLWYTHKNVNFLLRATERITNVIFTASSESFRLKSKKIKIVGHGIDTEYFIPSKDTSNKKNLFITIGRISQIKKLEVLIEAIDILKNEQLTIQLSIIGVENKSDKYLRKIQNIIEQKKLFNQISLIKAKPNREMVNELHKASLFLHASETGSLDKAVLEAMSCGVPPVSSSEAFTDILSEYKDILFFEKNNPQSLANSIKKYISLPKEAKDKIKIYIRNIVISKHSLEHLIKNISKEIK